MTKSLFADTEIARYRPLIRNRARRYHRGWVAVHCTLDDLEAAATVGVWQAVENYDKERGASFGTYVTQLVENELSKLCHYWNRSRRAAPVVSLSEGPDGELPVVLVSTGTRPDWRFDAASFRAQVHAAVDRLRPKQREVITLRYWHDQPQIDVAVQLGVSKQRVQSLESEALDRLRPKLAHLWPITEAA